jgi:2-methylcitrate dehydratase PrpD
MLIAERIAEASMALTYESLPEEAVHWAKVGILDYLGVTLAGSSEPAAKIACDAAVDPAGTGPSAIFGRAIRAMPLDAALVNGTASHALDFDDISNTMGGHPSAPVLSALFAAADERGSDGKAFIAAYVTGFEVETKLARGVNFHHYMKGWHPTATLGVFGSAVASARLLGLSASDTVTAIAIAASSAYGIKANLGTMTKPLHVGQCARSGLLAAKLASRGFTASADVFEHKHGFLDVYNGPGTYDVSRIFDQWAAPLDIVRPGMAIKQYPCCGSIHPALDAMLTIVRENDLPPERVEKVKAWLHPRRLQHTDRQWPNSSLDAKFSLQYCLARAVIDRKIVMNQFEGDAFADPQIRKLLAVIEAKPYTNAQFAEDNHFGGEVEVLTRDGKTLRAKVQQSVGRTSDDPLPASLLREKFVNCSAGVLTRESIDELYSMVQRFEHLTDVRSLTSLSNNGLKGECP